MTSKSSCKTSMCRSVVITVDMKAPSKLRTWAKELTIAVDFSAAAAQTVLG